MKRHRIIYGWLMTLIIGVSAGCAGGSPCPQPESLAQAAPPAMPPATSALQQKVIAQEKRIGELTQQLRLLKRIDLDGRKEH